MDKKISYIYGDSLTKGVILDEKTGRYRSGHVLDIAEFERALHVVVHNESMFGCTVEKGVQRLFKRLDTGAQCNKVLLEFGGNDCDFDWAQVAADPLNHHDPKTPFPRFKQIYTQAVKELQRRGIEVVVIMPPPIDSQRYFNWITRNGLNGDAIMTFLGEVQRIDHHQQLYATAAGQIALKNGCQLIDLRSPFLARPMLPLLCEDGIHMNTHGQELIMDTLREHYQLKTSA